MAVLGVAPNAWLEMLLAVCVGAAIGCITGFLVSKIGMPSFVVTLALFITWQGVILQFIGDGGVFGIRSSQVLFNVANGNLSVSAAGCCASSRAAATRRSCSASTSRGCARASSPSRRRSCCSRSAWSR